MKKNLLEKLFATQPKVGEITEALFDAGFEIKTIYGNWDGSTVGEDSPEMIFVAKRS